MFLGFGGATIYHLVYVCWCDNLKMNTFSFPPSPFHHHLPSSLSFPFSLYLPSLSSFLPSSRRRKRKASTKRRRSQVVLMLAWVVMWSMVQSQHQRPSALVLGSLTFTPTPLGWLEMFPQFLFKVISMDQERVMLFNHRPLYLLWVGCIHLDCTHIYVHYNMLLGYI